MAHMSEDVKRLTAERVDIRNIDEIGGQQCISRPNVYLLRFPAARSDDDAACSGSQFGALAERLKLFHKDSTVCVLTTPPDAARLLPYMHGVLKFQLWIPVKVTRETSPVHRGYLKERHIALLVFSRYVGSLRHTKTRIEYTYCPACGKTTKDYGGKKHVYHAYGTLMSDVWRDFAYHPTYDNDLVEDRLRDLFGLPPYTVLKVLDMTNCADFQPYVAAKARSWQLDIGRDDRCTPLDSRLVNDDCLQALAEVPDDSVDFCFADPPYNIRKKYDHWDDALELVEYFAWCDKWLSELARVLKPGRTLAVINIPLYAARHYQHLCTILRFQSWIAWEGLSLPVRMIMPAHYGLICFSKGNPRPAPGLMNDVAPADIPYLSPMEEFFCLRARCIQRRRSSDRGELTDLWHDIHRLKHNTRRVDHPCQLPPLLMRRLYAIYTKPGEVVLDPFNGSGTSTLVAEQMGRAYFGIELSKQYHELAQERHRMIAEGRDPFQKNPGVPKAKNSRVQRLPKQQYMISKKTLQLDVKRIAHTLGRLPSHEEVARLSVYPIEYFDNYFISWAEACAAARTTGMSELPLEVRAAQRQLALFSDNSEELTLPQRPGSRAAH